MNCMFVSLIDFLFFDRFKDRGTATQRYSVHVCEIWLWEQKERYNKTKEMYFEYDVEQSSMNHSTSI